MVVTVKRSSYTSTFFLHTNNLPSRSRGNDAVSFYLFQLSLSFLPPRLLEQWSHALENSGLSVGPTKLRNSKGANPQLSCVGLPKHAAASIQAHHSSPKRLWQELEAFETNLNRITAKRFKAVLSPAHMQARTVLRQLVNHVGAIYPPPKSENFIPSLPKFDASERALVDKWKAYLKWEEGNPLEIEDKDRSTLITRIQGV